jgi:hypothetical protein
MSEHGMLYLIFIGTAFLGFVGTLMWGMSQTPAERHDGEGPPRAA